MFGFHHAAPPPAHPPHQVNFAPVAIILKDMEIPLSTGSKDYQFMQTELSHLSAKGATHHITIHTNLSPSLPFSQYVSTVWSHTSHFLHTMGLNEVQIDSILVSIKHTPSDSRGHEFHHYQGGLDGDLKVVQVLGGAWRDSSDNIIVAIACIKFSQHLGVWGSVMSSVDREDIVKRLHIVAEYESKVRLHNLLLNATVYEQREGKRDKQSAFMIPTSTSTIKILT